MGGTLIESFAGLGRRRFFGQLAAGSAALVSGVFGLPAVASAHDERQTMAPATLGAQWGIRTYRLRQQGSGTATTRVVTQLLDGNGAVLGEFTRTQHFRIDVERTRKDDELYKKTRRFRQREEIQLVWNSESLEIDTRQETGTFSVKHNGRFVGTATVTAIDQTITPGLLTLTEQRPELLHIAADIGLDLTRALPEPPRESEGCCCGDLGCSGSLASCTVYDFRRSVACDNSQTCTGSECWNSLCVGCCQLYPCDCVCFPETDFFCFCNSLGVSCNCGHYCI